MIALLTLLAAESDPTSWPDVGMAAVIVIPVCVFFWALTR